jgi:hypothetical protein
MDEINSDILFGKEYYLVFFSLYSNTVSGIWDTGQEALYCEVSIRDYISYLQPCLRSRTIFMSAIRQNFLGG